MTRNSSVLQDLQNQDTLELSKLFAVSISPGRKKIKNGKKIAVDDPQESAKSANLRYVSDSHPGIIRRKNRKGFVYFDPNGKRFKDPAILQRIRSLAIPPAWTDVWICPHPSGHLQATGRDSKRRKQYRYHPRWRELRDSTKFDRMILFGEALPQIRERVENDLSLPGLPREKVIATIVRLLEITLIRVGNEEYVKANNSFGLTTLRNHHLEILGSKIRFRFRGKSGKQHNVGVKDRRLANILKKCQEIPGYELFQYINDEGEPVSIDSSDVNQYLREAAQQDFSAKDFRTWVGTVLTAIALREIAANHDGGNGTKKLANQAVEMVAKLLGNTKAVCRKCYIHPALLEGYTNGNLWKNFKKESPVVAGLAPEEAAILAYLRTL